MTNSIQTNTNNLLSSYTCISFPPILKMQPKIDPIFGDAVICRQFSFDEILAATNDFKEAIGVGGSAKVYKGKIGEEIMHTVAIKKSTFMSPELRSSFRDEITMVSEFRHNHLVTLIGYCETDDDMILVYEYMAGGTLEECLHNKFGDYFPISWVDRLKICIGAARGLYYLHTGTGTTTKVIHRDVKSSNILLDKSRSMAKISDFGMSKIGPANQEDTSFRTKVVGTIGYLDPDYYTTGVLTSKSDVYAFGVVLFEVLCGRPAVNILLHEDQWSLAAWARICVGNDSFEAMIDPHLRPQILPSCLLAYVKIAERCLSARGDERPTMSEVLAELVLALSLQEIRNASDGFRVRRKKIVKKVRLYFSRKVLVAQ